jgi:alkanesulfonate monooxygenase SsuD/methylene tetrahydromethanopterin reductase-like flavin-dependent oxidoreductase (luciferase family)
MNNSYGVLLPDGRDPRSFANRAAELDYERLWVGELWGADAFVQLARAGDAPIGLGTSIVNVYSRTPAAIAQAAVSIEHIASGEMILGLGTSTEQAVGSLHGVSFDRPVRRLHETTELVARLFDSDERVAYDGETVGVDGAPGFDVDIPVYTAALGPAARRATGRVADGWLPHNVPFDRLEEAFATIAETARERGRNPDDVTVAPYVPCAVSEDESAARDAIRGHLAYYVGSGEGYQRAVAESFPDEADAIADSWRDGDREAARAAVTDEMVDALGVAGTPANARDALESHLARDIVDTAIVVVPAGEPDLVDPTVEALSPSP